MRPSVTFLRRIAIVLLLGALTTASVSLALEKYYVANKRAWIFENIGYWHFGARGLWDISVVRRPGMHVHTQYYNDSRPLDVLPSLAEYALRRADLPRWVRTPPSDEPESGSPMVWINDVAYGWPLAAMYGHGSDVLPNSSWIPRDRPPGPAAARVCRAWIPLWPGFVINSALAAAVYAALGLAIAGIRRRSRRRHGRCHACGYPTSNLARCPECGAATVTP
jgi:hypothetical protein